MGHINLVKLCVGAEAPSDLIAWQRLRAGDATRYTPQHVTRMWPKRAEELLDGGSLYWVFKGQIQARQVITGLREVIGEDGVRRCAIELGQEVVLTQSAPRRPFQGWRYLKPEDAPRDLPRSRGDDDDLPADLAGALAEIGIL